MSMENRARLAFAAVLLLGAAGGFVWYLAASRQYATYQVRTQESVSGLIADAPVEFHGVEVGKVKRVDLIDNHTVSILLRVRKEAPVTRATIATITSRGLATRGFTGYVFVALEDAGSDFGPLAVRPGDRFPLIPTAPSRSVNLDTTISQVNERIEVITRLLQSVLDQKTVASLKETADNLQRVTRTLADNNARLASAIVNTDQASRQLRTLLASSNRTVGVVQTELLPQVREALANVDHLTHALRGVAADSNDAVKALQAQILPEAYRALSSLDDLTSVLHGVASKIDQDPSILIRGTPQAVPGPGETE